MSDTAIIGLVLVGLLVVFVAMGNIVGFFFELGRKKGPRTEYRFEEAKEMGWQYILQFPGEALGRKMRIRRAQQQS